MADPYLSEIRMMGFNFAPRGWAECNGQLLPINQNQALYSLLGTTYGGDGRTTFALPDLRERTPIHFNNEHRQGQAGGEQRHTLLLSELPTHPHGLVGSNTPAEANVGTDGYLAVVNNAYGPADNLVQFAASEVGMTGGNQAHQNMQPYQAVNFCIAITGVFPSRN